MADANGWSLGHSVNPYVEYSLTVEYAWSSGKTAVAVAEDQGGGSPQCEIVNCTKPVGMKTVRFSMVRSGEQPEIPDPVSPSTNEVLLNASVVLGDRKVAADGQTYLYPCSGQYTYALLSPIFTSQAKWPLGAVEQGTREATYLYQTGGTED